MVQGCRIRFDYPIAFHKSRTQPPFCLEEHLKIADEVSNMLDLGVLREISQDQVRFLSPIFSVPKKDGSLRLILNLKDLNESVEYKHFKMDTLYSAIAMMRTNCYMASIDLEKAYYSIPIHEDDQSLLAFQFDKRYFVYTAMPNGLASCPRDFTKICKPIYSTLRKMGLEILGYIDDTFLKVQLYQDCVYAVDNTVQLFTDLGFFVNIEKSVFKPSKQVVFLGFWLDSELMIVKLTEEKADKLILKCTQLLECDEASIRDVASVVGTLNAASAGVEYANLFIKNLERSKNVALKEKKGDFDKFMVISPQMKVDLLWWVKNVKTQVYHVERLTISVVIHTDASLLGWGCKSDDESSANGRWNATESTFHINCLELLAIFHALRALCAQMTDVHIRIVSDSSTAVYYIAKMGGIQSVQCNEIAKDIWLWCIDRNIWLSTEFKKGCLNIEADFLSRNFDDSAEWMLNKGCFDKICRLWGQPEVDLFASRVNRQVDKFVSWHPDPDAFHVNAFTLNWADCSFYAFPPFCLINGVLQKLFFDRAKGVLVVPLWTTQPWFSSLLKHLIDIPRVLRPRRKLLSIQSLEHPLKKSLQLLVCLVSGVPSDNRKFLQKLPILSCPRGERGLRNSMPFISGNGLSFVLEEREIICKWM